MGEIMNKVVIQSFIGTVVALLLAVFIGYAGSQGGLEILGLPLFGLCAALAIGAQWLAFIPSYLSRTEHFYDLMGSITYISVTLFALMAAGNYDPRSLLIAVMVLIWAGRLGTFLFARVRAAGFDRRFSKMLDIPMQFFMTWTLQGLWVNVTLAAGMAALTSDPVALGPLAIIGSIVWLIGFAIEVVADRQKTKFREENKDGFITTGIWSWSRHPNYFGEIVLWIGIAILAIPTLSGWQWATMISPVFVIVLLTKISGVRMLEVSGKKRWGNNEDYQAYVANTSVLIPLPPKAAT
jgi:steroid 5-alpha reductase family enzyme